MTNKTNYFEASPQYRIFVLGAGFSRPAGLPLTTDLFGKIVSIAKAKGLYTPLKKDIEGFLEYLEGTRHISIREEQINFEEFISYLDIEHFLQLKGSDHWSAEGNLSQLLVRNLITLILQQAESAITDDQFSLYEDFAGRLQPGDWIITFNYDTILETAFLRKSIPFRLFPTRYKNVSFAGGEVERTDEIVLLKMHGSINWFDVSAFDNNQKALREQPIYVKPKHEVFAEEKKNLSMEMIINGPYPTDSPLRKLYQTKDIGKYLSNCSYFLTAPFIVSPSYTKIVYLNPIVEFWRGFNSMGVGNGSVIIIGFSFPDHDDYVKQPLYHLIDNFQHNDCYK